MSNTGNALQLASSHKAFQNSWTENSSQKAVLTSAGTWEYNQVNCTRKHLW